MKNEYLQGTKNAKSLRIMAGFIILKSDCFRFHILEN